MKGKSNIKVEYPIPQGREKANFYEWNGMNGIKGKPQG